MKRLGQLFRSLFLAGFVTVLVVGVATPASAHDSVVGTTPADGDTINSVPASIAFEFSAEILPTGFAAKIAGTDGKDWVGGPGSVDGVILNIPVNPDIPGGEYTVTVAVVSSDAHRIEASTTFTLEREVIVEEPSPSVSESADQSANQSTPPSAEASETTSDMANNALLFAVAGVVLLVGVAVIVAVIRRKKQANR